MPITRIEGYAIISQDGMIADHAGHMPAVLQVKEDQEFFHGGLDRSAVVVHGRRSHEGGANADRRFRLLVTSRVPTLLRHERHHNALWWNPAGASLMEAWSALGAPSGTLAVIGGAKVYEVFWEMRYDAFHLTRVAHARLPAGRPIFSGVTSGKTPEEVLASHGLVASSERILDARAGVTLVSWIAAK
jgi:dihydrofolate reductase